MKGKIIFYFMQYDIFSVIRFALMVSLLITNIHHGHQGLQIYKEHKMCIMHIEVQLFIVVNLSSSRNQKQIFRLCNTILLTEHAGVVAALDCILEVFSHNLSQTQRIITIFTSVCS
jgi:hypothetical protein